MFRKERLRYMEEIKQAAKIIKQGGIVIFPTDTAYGIGCSLSNVKAIKRLFKIRKRPTTQATPVLFPSIEWIEYYIPSVDNEVRELMEKYWPGALTIVLPCHIDKVPDLVRGGGDNLGVRIPDNDKILDIMKLAETPILGPSANFHGEKTPYSFEELNKDLVKIADFVVKGEVKLKQASTVLDCTKKPWQVLREGAVKISE